MNDDVVDLQNGPGAKGLPELREALHRQLGSWLMGRSVDATAGEQRHLIALRVPKPQTR